MILNFTQKETSLLQDQKSHEEMCIKKYSNYSKMAADPELKTLFSNLANKERTHLDSINQLISGQLPNMNSQGGGQGGQSSSMEGQASSIQSQASPMGGQASSMAGQTQSTIQGQGGQAQMTDKDICADMLLTEKYISGTYDTAIFEFTQPQVRSVLNHIQKEEQEHGESVFKYMENQGMYQPK